MIKNHHEIKGSETRITKTNQIEMDAIKNLNFKKNNY
jgi:hypothetical protein